jgi:hypothetical protein
MKFAALILCVLISGIFMVTSLEAKHGDDDRHSDDHSQHDSKFHGKVEQRPEENIGIWTIEGKEVQVTKDTVFVELHGKAILGSFVEVEGNTIDGKFVAVKIETEDRTN